MSSTVVQVSTDRVDLDAVPATQEMPFGHQPRESSVPCSGCQKPTWNFHARCNGCEPVTCQRCGEPGDSTRVVSDLID